MTSARIVQPSKSTDESSRPQTLNALITEYLANTREADPHVIAGALVTQLSAELRDELLLAGVVYKVRQVMALQRSAAGLGGSSTRTKGPSKWEIAIPVRVTIAGVPKLVDECDLSDLETLAKDYRERGKDMFARAKDADMLADALRASGCRTVGEMWAAQGEDLAA